MALVVTGLTVTLAIANRRARACSAGAWRRSSTSPGSSCCSPACTCVVLVQQHQRRRSAGRSSARRPSWQESLAKFVQRTPDRRRDDRLRRDRRGHRARLVLRRRPADRSARRDEPRIVTAPSVRRAARPRPACVEECDLRSRFGFMAYHGGSLEEMTDVIAADAAERSGASYYGVLQPPRPAAGTSRRTASSAESPAPGRVPRPRRRRHHRPRLRPPRACSPRCLLGGQNRELADHVARSPARAPPRLRDRHRPRADPEGAARPARSATR